MKRNIVKSGGNYIDADTGEIFEQGLPVFVTTRTALMRIYPEGWISMSQKANVIIAQDDDLKLEQHKVLRYLEGRVDFENYIRVPQSEICDALHMKKQNVSKAINVLVDKGILLRGPKVGHSYVFRFNPTYGYKGNAHGKVLRLPDGQNVFRLIEGGKEEAGRPKPAENMQQPFEEHEQ